MSGRGPKCTCCSDTIGSKRLFKIKSKAKTIKLPKKVKDTRPLALQKTKAHTAACARGVYTITFGDVAENGIGMEQIGQIHDRGLSIEELFEAQRRFDDIGLQTEWIDLTKALGDNELKYLRGEGKPIAIKKKSQLPETMGEVQAGVLIVRNGVGAFVEDKDGKTAADRLKEEQQQIKYDTRKRNRYKNVVRSIGRHNVCFDDFDQELHPEEGKGTVVDFNRLPLLSQIREGLPEYIPELKNIKLKAEGNYYYNKQCGIGWHGDTERRIVIAVRLGESMDINYNWWYGRQRVGKRVSMILNHGDMYFMSDKAAGTDWLSPSKLTLRHCAGAFDKRDF